MVKIHSKEKILKLLLSNKTEEFTIRAIAKKISVDYKTVNLSIKLLIDDNVIKSKKAGQTILCSINQKNFNSDIFRAESSRRQDLLANKDMHGLYRKIEENASKHFFTLLLFGSYASGKAEARSDIDLMLITDNDFTKKEIEHLLSILPLRTHLVVFNSEEFLSMLKTTEFNVGKEAFNNNIILFGIEDYYRLIQNA